jgi:hypothetical protein
MTPADALVSSFAPGETVPGGPSLGSMALELSEHVFVASMVAWTMASAGVLRRLSARPTAATPSVSVADSHLRVPGQRANRFNDAA